MGTALFVAPRGVRAAKLSGPSVPSVSTREPVGFQVMAFRAPQTAAPV